MVRVVFLHPDLGIGGAERAVIDAAIALQAQNHKVEFVTAHHDSKHCFEETRNGTVKVTAVGDWLPRSIFGRCYALCAYIRMIYAALYLVMCSGKKPDIVFCDQISACIPILKLLSSAKVLFFCHFPDMLLTKRESFFKKVYRAPLDWLEEKTTGMAHMILVNSKFTANIFKETFTSLSHIEPVVLYPIPDFSMFNQEFEPSSQDLIPNCKTVFLSINRYERKKNIALAVQALGYLKETEDLTGIHLVIAGGYDDRVVENKEYYLELRLLTEKLSLQNNVTFLRSFTNQEKVLLLAQCDCLIYTPDREHFGIVPVEAMYMKCPVIAVKSGGPLETVADGITGYLCEPNEKAFAKAMKVFINDKYVAKEMGNAGKQRITDKFSSEVFSQQLNDLILELCTM